MSFYLAYISYDGTGFSGFQKQINQRTIQGEIEKSLSKLNGYETKILYAGRTDSHVHALENVISFELKKNFSSETLKKILNSLLPFDIRINNIKQTYSIINPRFYARKRIYIYLIYKYEPLPPFLQNYAISINTIIKNKKFDPSLFNYILSNFQGFHNFKAFTTSKETRNSYRTIYSIFIKEKSDFFFIYISGKSFLHKMVRSIIGASFEIYRKNLDLNLIKSSLVDGKKCFPFRIFPPHPLYLKKIVF